MLRMCMCTHAFTTCPVCTRMRARACLVHVQVWHAYNMAHVHVHMCRYMYTQAHVCGSCTRAHRKGRPAGVPSIFVRIMGDSHMMPSQKSGDLTGCHDRLGRFVLSGGRMGIHTRIGALPVRCHVVIAGVGRACGSQPLSRTRGRDGRGTPFTPRGPPSALLEGVRLGSLSSRAG